MQTVHQFNAAPSSWLALQKIYLFVIADPGAIFSSLFPTQVTIPPESLAGSPRTFHALPHPQLSLMEVRWILFYTNTSATPPAEKLCEDYSPRPFSPWQAASSWGHCPAASRPLKVTLFAVGRAGTRDTRQDAIWHPAVALTARALQHSASRTMGAKPGEKKDASSPQLSSQPVLPSNTLHTQVLHAVRKHLVLPPLGSVTKGILKKNGTCKCASHLSPDIHLFSRAC